MEKHNGMRKDGLSSRVGRVFSKGNAFFLLTIGVEVACDPLLVTEMHFTKFSLKVLAEKSAHLLLTMSREHIATIVLAATILGLKVKLKLRAENKDRKNQGLDVMVEPLN